jgi:hypothetical protein
MIDAINLLLLKKYEESAYPEASEESINTWLQQGQNYQRLQRECEKIWGHSIHDEKYDAERAFRVLCQRLIGVCHQETVSAFALRRESR